MKTSLHYLMLFPFCLFVGCGRLPKPSSYVKKSLPYDLIAVSDARYASLTNLAKGSSDAQSYQAASVEATGLPLEVRTKQSGIAMRLVPSGSVFENKHMSSEPSRRRKLTIEQPIYVGKYEITQSTWELVMQNNPSNYIGPELPVECVSWNEVQEFIRKLCELENVPNGTYRLLTEREWIYCCRSGSAGLLYLDGDDKSIRCYNQRLMQSARYAGNSATQPKGAIAFSGDETWLYTNQKFDREKQAWIIETKGQTQGVGKYRPNAFGLYDMLGNVAEWVDDTLSNNMDGRRKAMGGSFLNLECYPESNVIRPTQGRYNYIGFRVARNVEKVPSRGHVPITPSDSAEKSPSFACFRRRAFISLWSAPSVSSF